MFKELVERQKQWLDKTADRPLTNKEGLILTWTLMGMGFFYGALIMKEKAEQEKHYLDWDWLRDPDTGEIIGDKYEYKVTEAYVDKTVTVFGKEFKYRKRVRNL